MHVTLRTPCEHRRASTAEAPSHNLIECPTCGRRWKADVSISGVVAYREEFGE